MVLAGQPASHVGPLRLIVAGPERVNRGAKNFPKILLELFQEKGIEVENISVHHSDDYSDVDLVGIDPLASDLLIMNCHLPKTAWERLRHLKRVFKLGRLRPGIDETVLRMSGITYQRLTDPAYVSVAEHTLMLMLACGHRLEETLIPVGSKMPADWPDQIRTSQNTRMTNWLRLDETRFRLLWRNRLGIIGLGEIGFELATRARGLGMEVWYCNRSPLPAEAETSLGLQRATKRELLDHCPFVAVTCTVPSGGEAVVTAEDLANLNGNVIINVSRGSALDEAAVIDAARAGRLQGLGLDVYSMEPVDATGFHGARNTYLTAHTAGAAGGDQRFDEYVDQVSGIISGTGTEVPSSVHL